MNKKTAVLLSGGSIIHGDDRGEGGTSTTATDFIHDLRIKVKGIEKAFLNPYNLANALMLKKSILFLDACSSQWYPCAQCLASSLSILLIPIVTPALIIECRDVGIWTVNRDDKFISTKYTQRPDNVRGVLLPKERRL